MFLHLKSDQAKSIICPFLKHIAAKGRPVIASTGMQSIETLDRSVSILREAKIPLILLECTNLYPSLPEIVI